MTWWSMMQYDVDEERDDEYYDDNDYEPTTVYVSD